MSSERYDEQYIEIDGIKVLTYLVPDYDSVPETGEYHDGTPRSKWLKGQPMVDRKHGWIIGDDVQLPEPHFDNDSWAQAALAIRWTFIDAYWESQLEADDAPDYALWLLFDRTSGVLSDLEADDVIGKFATVDTTSELTPFALIEVEKGATVPHSDLLSTVAQIMDFGEEYDNSHTPEGYEILWQDLPLMGWHEHRYFSADAWQVTEDPYERARQLASDYVRRENFGHTWGYYGVCAKWTGPDGELVEDSVWMVDVDFGDSDSDYVRSIREDVASEVAHEAKAILEYHAEIEAEARREAEAQARRVFYEGAGL